MNKVSDAVVVGVLLLTVVGCSCRPSGTNRAGERKKESVAGDPKTNAESPQDRGDRKGGGNEPSNSSASSRDVPTEGPTKSPTNTKRSETAATAAAGKQQIASSMASAGKLADRGDFQGAYNELEGTWVKLRQRGVEGPDMDALLSQMEEFGEKQQLRTPKSISNKKYKIK